MPIIVHTLYGGDVEISFEDPGHKYTRIKPGPETVLAGVTSKTGILDKPALKNWHLSQAWGAVKKLIGPGEFVTADTYDKIQPAIMETGTATKEKAGDLGREIHDWISQYIKSLVGFNGMPAMSINLIVSRCCKAWVAWQAERNIEWIDSERLVYSMAHDAVGTLDQVGLLGNIKTLFDVKTGSGIYEEYWLQVGGYYLFYNEEMRYIGDTPIEQGQIIRLDKKTGLVYPSVLLPQEILEELAEHFLLTHKLYNWRNRWSKQLKALVKEAAE